MCRNLGLRKWKPHYYAVIPRGIRWVPPRRSPTANDAPPDSVPRRNGSVRPVLQKSSKRRRIVSKKSARALQVGESLHGDRGSSGRLNRGKYSRGPMLLRDTQWALGPQSTAPGMPLPRNTHCGGWAGYAGLRWCIEDIATKIWVQ